MPTVTRVYAYYETESTESLPVSLEYDMQGHVRSIDDPILIQRITELNLSNEGKAVFTICLDELLSIIT